MMLLLDNLKTLNITWLSKKIRSDEAGKRACETPDGEFLRRHYSLDLASLATASSIVPTM
jgi:hypothetical protein